MKAKITLPSGTIVEVDATEAEILRLAGGPGYRLQMLPQPATAICICGRAYWSVVPPTCPVHGAPFRFSWGPTCAAGAAQPFGQVWIGTIGGAQS